MEWKSMKLDNWKCLVLALTLCLTGFSAIAIDRKNLKTLVGRATGILPWDLAELSGLAHCRSIPDQLWAVNDRGDQARLYALSPKAELLQTYHLRGESNQDWEDLACGRCANSDSECLYIADIGDNHGKRRDIKLFMIPLPLKGQKTSKGLNVKRRRILLRYPDKPHNAESLLVHPDQPIAVIITKEKHDPRDRVDPLIFTIDLAKALGRSGRTTLTPAGSVPLYQYLTPKNPPSSAWITGGDFFPNGQSLLLITYTHIYRMQWPLIEDEQSRIILPIWSNVNRTQIESVAVHNNGKQFWIGSEVNRSREPLILMEMPQN